MASTYLTRTFQSGGNRKKWTMSMWVKRSGLGATNILFQTYVSTYTFCPFDSSDRLQFQDGNGGNKVTSMKFRDTNAWYHIVVAIDTDNSTADDRYKIYVNGERITAFDTSSNPSSGYEGEWNKAQLMNIGRHHSSGNYHDGYMSHIHFCDGYQYQASDFGETDATTGEWKIKTSPSVSYGTTGFFILKDGNTVTDSSSNSNTWTANGTLTKTEDCPSNVFATINPLDYSPNPATLQNGNTTYNKSSTGDTHNASMTGTLGAMTGKWYFEFKPTNTTNFVLGMVRTNHGLPNSEGYYANDAGCYGISNGGKTVGGSGTSISYSYSANDILGMAFDLDNGKFYAHVNGTYITSGDPTSGSTGTGSLGDISLGSNIYVPFVTNANYNATNLIYFNFGNGYFGTTAVSSAGTNASGNGIFEYDVPTGYTALSTKGLNL